MERVSGALSAGQMEQGSGVTSVRHTHTDLRKEAPCLPLARRILLECCQQQALEGSGCDEDIQGEEANSCSSSKGVEGRRGRKAGVGRKAAAGGGGHRPAGPPHGDLPYVKCTAT